jgi:hypothetical protein
MLLSGRKLQDVNDHQPRVLLAIADITERKRALEALLASEKMAATGRLAASLAHEINNPLCSVGNIMYLLGRDKTLAQPSRNLVQTAEQELGRISHITKSTLAFYRDAESPVDIKLSEQIESALAMLAPKLTAKKVAVAKQFRSDGGLRAFPGEIRQVLTSLIENAIEAVPEGGTIKIRVADGRSWTNPEQYRRSVGDVSSTRSSPPKEKKEPAWACGSYVASWTKTAARFAFAAAIARAAPAAASRCSCHKTARRSRQSTPCAARFRRARGRCQIPPTAAGSLLFRSARGHRRRGIA